MKLFTQQKVTLLSLCAITTFALSFHTLAAKEVFKWHDADGGVHYTDKKPLNNDKTTKVRVTNVEGNTEEAKQLEERVKEHNKQREEAAAVTAPANAKDPKLCESAKKNLKVLNENSRVKVQEGESNRFLSPEEYQEQKTITLKQIKDAC